MKGKQNLEDAKFLTWIVRNNPGALASLRAGQVQYVEISQQGAIHPIEGRPKITK